MHPSIRVSQWVLMMSIVAGVLSTSGVWAADHDFSTKIVYRVLSVEEVDGQLVIEAEGAGESRLLGSVMAAASVKQSVLPDPCYSYSADFHLSVAAGTIQIHSGGMVCPAPTQITGTWSVTGGTGPFLRATGSGTEDGKHSFTGKDPVVDQLQGTLSYQEPGSSPPVSVEDCIALVDQYDRAYQEAKACNPLADRVDQCTELVTNGLMCGCPGVVNPRHKRALKVMEAAQQEFTDAGCSGFWDCIGGLCPGVYGASCVGEGAQGLCIEWSPW
jgi:hypothetical protein